MSKSHKKLPAHTQLQLPLVETIRAMGGGKPKDVCMALAEQLDIPPEIRDHTVAINGRNVRTWDRRVRWVRQQLIKPNIITDDRYAFWDLTETGREHLQNCKPGVIVTVYETDAGVVMWAEAQAAARSVQKGSVNLIFTSPPYPLNKKKSYGNFRGQFYLDWLLDHAKTWKEILAEDGSLFLNLGDVWNAGMPTQDLYKERLLLNLCDNLGYHLAQEYFWLNPAAPPSSEWVTVRRCRVKPAVERLFWLSKTPHPKANNRNVLRPYSERMLKLIAEGGDSRGQRPSGHGGTKNAFGRNNGGSIPHNLIVASNSESSGPYFQYCRKMGLPIHPARFPRELPEFAVKLTTDVGDIGADFFGGSLTFAKVCEDFGRQFITSDKSLSFLRGGAQRFLNSKGFIDHTQFIPLQAAG